MAIATTLIKINGVDVPVVRGYKVGINKLWADAGRNMKGELKSTFVGNFLKIKVDIGYTTPAQIDTLRDMLDNAFLTVLWFDEKLGALRSSTCYPNDFEYGVYNNDLELYAPFSFNLISTKKI